MSEPTPDDSDDDARDWMASAFGDDDYVGDDWIGGTVVDVADGTQVEAPGDDAGWAVSLDDDAPGGGG